MCWNIEVSLIAGVYGYLVSAYLFRRNYSIRDKWYSAFLATFTTTQMLDAFFWWQKGESDQIPCTEVNYYLSKYFIPPILFFQPIVLSYYPSSSSILFRSPYRIACVILIFVSIPLVFSGCTTVWQTTGGYWEGLYVIIYGGNMPSIPIMLGGIAFWSIGVPLFVTPWWVGGHILFIGGLNMVLLYTLDGTIQLVSKLCFYCLLLSIMWLFEPLYEPSLRPKEQVQMLGDDEIPLMSKEAIDDDSSAAQQQLQVVVV